MINQIKRIEGYEGYMNLFCIDESMKEVNPTGTFKDRQPKALEILLKDQTNPITLGAMSTGNTAYSILYFAKKHNAQGRHKITPVIYTPRDFENREYFGPDVNGLKISGKEYLEVLKNLANETGGKIIPLDFGKAGQSSADYLSTLRLARVANDAGLVKEGGLFLNITEGLENTAFINLDQIANLSEERYSKLPKLGIKAYQPIIVEGIKELNKRFGVNPDYVICQFGAGILFNEVKDYLAKILPKTEIIPVAVGDAKSCADKIYPSYWTINSDKLRGGGTTESRHDRSTVYGLEDWELGRALSMLKGKLDAEVSGVAGFAPLYRLEELIPRFDRQKDVILTINTGNGLPNFRGKNGN